MWEEVSGGKCQSSPGHCCYQARGTAQLLLLCSERWVGKVRQGDLGPGSIQPRETKVSNPRPGGHKGGVLCCLLEGPGRTEQS